MVSKDILFSNHKKNYKPIFLLAWSHMLTYDDLKKYDYIEAYTSANLSGCCRTIKDWDNNIIEYNEDNVKKMLCIELNKSINAASEEGVNAYYELHIDDLCTWLYMLEDHDIKMPTGKITKEIAEEFYNDISKKYKFEI